MRSSFGGPSEWWAAATVASPSGPATQTAPKATTTSTDLHGQAAGATGGATGLGRAVALEFARQGCTVAFCWFEMGGRDVEASALLTETSLSAMGAKVLAARCDVRDRDQVDRFIAEVVRRFGT